MKRLSRFMFAAIATLALPASSAFAQEFDGEVGAEDTDDTSADPGADSAGGVTAEAPAPAGAWSRSVIDRQVTLPTGKVGAGANLAVARVSLLGMSATATGMGLVGGYGVNDKLSVGGAYAFSIDEFDIKGPLTLYGAYSLIDDGKLTVGASADLVLDFAGDSTDIALNAGVAARYKITPQLAVFSGNPYALGPLGQQLRLGLSDGAAKTFSIPVGLGFQATPELFAYAETTLATILLSDPGMGDRVSFIGDLIPLTLGAFYSINPNIDATVAFSMVDVPNAGDFFTFLVGARYFTN